MSEERAIFITGGASGIGLAVARLFAARGWRVGLADVNRAGLDAACAALPGGHALPFVMDVRERDQWQAALAGFTGATGRLDVLFNNAGIAVGGALAESDPAELDRLIAINFGGVVNGARIGHAFLKATPGSCLLNTASAAGIYGSPGLAVYSATKFAVRGLTEALDGEWAADGIRVRAILPSFIDTPLLDVTTRGTNRTARESVQAAGLEFTPVETVAEMAWAAVHGERLHTVIGKTARRLAFAARWMPGQLRRQLRRGGLGLEPRGRD